MVQAYSKEEERPIRRLIDTYIHKYIHPNNKASAIIVSDIIVRESSSGLSKITHPLSSKAKN